MLCYIGCVPKCVQAGDSSRFFYFRLPRFGFREYVEARHARACPTTHIEPKACVLAARGRGRSLRRPAPGVRQECARTCARTCARKCACLKFLPLLAAMPWTATAT